MSVSTQSQPEQLARKKIDAQLVSAGWSADSELLRYASGVRPEAGKNLALAEVPFGDGIADYALFAGLQLVGIVEAKKGNKDISSDLRQAQEYASNAEKFCLEIGNIELCGKWGEYHVPFVYASNGRDFVKQIETKSGIWFRDVRLSSNHARALQGFHAPQTLLEMLKHDEANAHQRLQAESFNYLTDKNGLGLRYYQMQGIQAVEQTLERGHRAILLAMATGTGKTRLAIGLCYRLIKSRRFRRILFLVDRSLLAMQAINRFNDVRIEDFQTFSSIYHVADIEAKIPDDDTKLHFATVQGLVRRLFYPEANEKPLPIDAYDCIIIDEAHRGYTPDKEVSEEETHFRNLDEYTSQYRRVLEYFDAVRIGLTATPALHTAEIFGKPVFHYSYRQAVVDGVLIDHEPPFTITTELNQGGIKWQKGETPEAFRQSTGEVVELAALPDDVTIEIDGFNKRVITKHFNRVVCQELVKHLDPDSEQKTLIFCANDAHADLVVQTLKEEFLQAGIPVQDRAITKITGSVYDPEAATRQFTNERYPTIVATVDLLSTGIDVPSICNIVFLRRVKSRILYEQMLGRATRLCPEIGKTHFRIFDAVRLYEAMKEVSDMKPVTTGVSKTFAVLSEELKSVENVDNSEQYSTTIMEEIAAKFHRVKRNLTPQSRDAFAKALGKSPEIFFAELRSMPVQERLEEMRKAQELLVSFDTRLSQEGLTMISNHEDRLLSVERGYGTKGTDKPADYIEQFRKFLEENINTVPALRIVCQRPAELTKETLRELLLILQEKGFSPNAVQTAWQSLHSITNVEAVSDIIAYIRTLALGEALQSYESRVKTAVQRIKSERAWNVTQLKWLDRIEKQMILELTLTRESFDHEPFKAQGGFRTLNPIFNNELELIVGRIQQEMFRQAS